jgi:S-DNA-T family DNA segregation ATPase FtsK/SpoIIIE
MPKPDSSNPNRGSAFPAARYQPNWLAAGACLVLGLLLTVALVDYDPAQTTFHSTSPTARNLTGWLGANVCWILLNTFGMSTWLLPFFFGRIVYLSVRNVRRLVVTRLVAMAVAVLSFSGLWAMLEFIFKPGDYFPGGPGGVVGEVLYRKGLAEPLGSFGSGLLFITLYGVALLFVFSKDIVADLERMVASFHTWREARAERKAELAAARLAEREEQARLKAAAAASASAAISRSGAPAPSTPAARGATPPAAAAGGIGAAKVFGPKPGEDPVARPAPRSPADAVAPAKAGPKIELNIVKPEESKKVRLTVLQSADDPYKFPPLKLLKEQVRPAAGNTEEEHRQNAETLLRILGEFGVEVTLGEIHVGPVITRYEVVPAAGVRVERIAGLDKNIALGMRAQSVRILAPIPGKAAVGVEVPNLHPTPVGMRELLESEAWAGAKAELPIALGKDVSGQPLISDLAKMPHLLIAGATGSGKSVCINSIVASILYSKSPRDVRLIMVDPKVVELKIFNSLPHMFIPVVTEPKKVPAALKWLLREMEQRYQIFAKVNVRNIVGFNSRKRVSADEAPPEAQPTLGGLDPLDDLEIPEHLPYIVAIIDELADLMNVAPADIETCIARLAQLARAAGIHLIIATQRPSVNVITGVIKANLPSRIAFQVASQIDSRTILDTKGAETLIGRGDMLFSPPGTARLVRSQGAFVSDEEVQGLVDYLKENNDPPVYAQAVQQQIDRDSREDDEESDSDDGEIGDDEELYRLAIGVLKASRRASTSLLQRKLSIGYNRAARIMDLMQEKGIVGPENGSNPRDILVDLDQL